MQTIIGRRDYEVSLRKPEISERGVGLRPTQLAPTAQSARRLLGLTSISLPSMPAYKGGR